MNIIKRRWSIKINIIKENDGNKLSTNEMMTVKNDIISKILLERIDIIKKRWLKGINIIKRRWPEEIDIIKRR